MSGAATAAACSRTGCAVPVGRYPAGPAGPVPTAPLPAAAGQVPTGPPGQVPAGRG